MPLISSSRPDGGTIPEAFAAGQPDPATAVSCPADRSPQPAWRGAPTRAKRDAPDVARRAVDGSFSGAAR